MTSQVSQQCCNKLFYTSSTVHMTWCERERPNILSICKIKHTLTLPREMFIAQQLMSLVLRNAFDIHVLTAINLSEADWNIQHAFWIWVYTDYFGSLRMPLMPVFGIQKEILDVNRPKTSYCSYARPAQPGPNRTRLCRPYIAAITGD